MNTEAANLLNREHSDMWKKLELEAKKAIRPSHRFGLYVLASIAGSLRVLAAESIRTRKALESIDKRGVWKKSR